MIVTRYGARAGDERGAVAVVVAITMTVVLAMAALVVDIGSIQARRAQLQEAADSAVLAIAQQCAKAPATTLASCAGTVLSTSTALASQLALDNLPGATVGTPVFTSSTVSVTVSSAQVGIFSGMLGTSSTALTATATAKWTPPVTPLPLAYQECALPAASPTTKVFLRTDLLKVLNLVTTDCGLISDVTGLLGASWAVGSGCSFDVDLLTYVGGVLSSVLPSECVSMVNALPGKEVIVPVYTRALVDIVVNGVLLGHGYQVEKYALIQLTGFDFQSLDLFGLTLGGPKSMPGDPQCPTLLGLELPLCQGLQGYLVGYLTPDEAKQRIAGAQLIA